MTDKDTLELAKLYAREDGCEGGDLLVTLIDAAEMAEDGRGYSYAEGSETFDKIMEAIRLECAAHRAMIFSDKPSNFGYYNWAELQEMILELERKARDSNPQPD